MSGDDEDVISTLEIDLEVAHCGEILEAHGVVPTSDLVVALWEWMEDARKKLGRL